MQCSVLDLSEKQSELDEGVWADCNVIRLVIARCGKGKAASRPVLHLCARGLSSSWIRYNCLYVPKDASSSKKVERVGVLYANAHHFPSLNFSLSSLSLCRLHVVVLHPQCAPILFLLFDYHFVMLFFSLCFSGVMSSLPRRSRPSSRTCNPCSKRRRRVTLRNSARALMRFSARRSPCTTRRPLTITKPWPTTRGRS